MKMISKHLYNFTEALSSSTQIDGEAFGQEQGLSRTTVWKMAHKLMDYGVEVTSSKGKGYSLKEPLWLLNKEKILSMLACKNIELIVGESTSSTNEVAMKYALSEVPLCVVLAETQKKGRGRFDRHWYSPFAKNIYLSIKYSGEIDLSCLGGFSLAVALSVTKVLEPYLSRPILVKWPNDLLVDGKKLCGCLIELSAQSHGTCSLVIGIGINVNQSEAPDYLENWTSLKCLSGNTIDRNHIVAELINEIIVMKKRFFEYGFGVFLEDMTQKDCLLHKKVRVRWGEKIFTGLATGISPQGQLLVDIKGEIITFSAGEVTLDAY